MHRLPDTLPEAAECISEAVSEAERDSPETTERISEKVSETKRISPEACSFQQCA